MHNKENATLHHWIPNVRSNILYMIVLSRHIYLHAFTTARTRKNRMKTGTTNIRRWTQSRTKMSTPNGAFAPMRDTVRSSTRTEATYPKRTVYLSAERCRFLGTIDPLVSFVTTIQSAAHNYAEICQYLSTSAAMGIFRGARKEDHHFRRPSFLFRPPRIIAYDKTTNPPSLPPRPQPPFCIPPSPRQLPSSSTRQVTKKTDKANKTPLTKTRKGLLVSAKTTVTELIGKFRFGKSNTLTDVPLGDHLQGNPSRSSLYQR